VSTVVIVKKNGHTAIAADTLASFGTRKLSAAYQRRASKLLRVGESYIGATGWGVQLLVLEHLFASMSAPPRLAGKAEIFELLLKMHQRLKEAYYLTPRSSEDDAFESSQLFLMIANPHGIFGVYSNRSVIEFERFWASGSGMDYALGSMHASYDGSDDAKSIAEAAVRAAIEFDDGTGGPVESYAIQLDAARAAEELDLLLKV
jgi:ATP-dependent HslUV protease, peptidase subunit HslV